MKIKNCISVAAFAALVMTTACKKNEGEKPPPSPSESEGQFVRLFVSDQDLANYYTVSPAKGAVETQAGQYAGGSLYPSPSGQFVCVINSAQNFATFFDSGIEEHGDHADIKYQPKWTLAKSTAAKPSHFYGRDNNLLVFNDGEGTISHFKETSLYTETSARSFSVGIAHHGAPALFSNGTIAVTEKDGSVGGSLPERVKVIDKEGKTLYHSTIQTKGIHGEAGNGEMALYGSTAGIVKVSSAGAQSLIPYPASFGATWLGSVYYGVGSKLFIGFKKEFGLYKIDPVANSVNAIEENTKLFSATFDWKGNHLLVLYTDGLVKVFGGPSFSVLASKKLSINFPAPPVTKGNPVVAASEHFVYITDGLNKNIKMYKKENLEFVKEIALPGQPAKIALMGSLARHADSH